MSEDPRPNSVTNHVELDSQNPEQRFRTTVSDRLGDLDPTGTTKSLLEPGVYSRFNAIDIDLADGGTTHLLLTMGGQRNMHRDIILHTNRIVGVWLTERIIENKKVRTLGQFKVRPVNLGKGSSITVSVVELNEAQYDAALQEYNSNGQFDDAVKAWGTQLEWGDLMQELQMDAIVSIIQNGTVNRDVQRKRINHRTEARIEEQVTDHRILAKMQMQP